MSLFPVPTWPTWPAAIWEAERRRLVLFLPVCMGVGVLVYDSLRFEPPVSLGSAILPPLIGLAILSRRWRVVAGLFVACIAATLGFTSAQLATARSIPLIADLPRGAVVVTGRVRVVEALPVGRRITLEKAVLGDTTLELKRTVRVRLRNNDPVQLATGDGVRIRALLRTPAPPSYPGGWDLQREAFFAGLGASGYALGAAEVTTRATPSSAARWVQRLRELISARVTAVIPGSAGAVSVTLLTGAAMAIPEHDHAAFRDSGLAHLLAVAGLHIGIVMGFVLLVSRTGFALSVHASLHWPTRKLSGMAALAAGGGYMVLTGMHVPIMRSFAMACLFTLAVLTGRRPVSVRGLGVAAVVLMLVAPQEVSGVSFQMSFSAVLALIAGYEALRPWLRRLHGTGWHHVVGGHIVALALTSALAGTASMPYGAYHFGQIQIYYVIANMIAVPMTAFWTMPLGLIALLLMPLGLDYPVLVAMGWGAEAIVWVARTTASWPDAVITVPHIPAWGLGVLSLGLAWLGLFRTWLRLAGVIGLLAGLASPAFDRPPDVLVSSDGRLIGVRTEAGVYLQQVQGGSGFVRDAWTQLWASGRPLAFPKDGTVAAGMITCMPEYCLLRPHQNARAAILVRGSQHPAGCSQASVIVSAEPARRLCPRPWPKLVDRFTVWRDGAAAIWLEPLGARIVTDRQVRGDRPWVPPMPSPRPRAVVSGAPPPPELEKPENTVK